MCEGMFSNVVAHMVIHKEQTNTYINAALLGSLLSASAMWAKNGKNIFRKEYNLNQNGKWTS